MADEPRSLKKLAVLIDAENVSHKFAGALFDEIVKLGDASVRRVYGDFSGTGLKGWADLLEKYDVIPQNSSTLIPRKNSSDITLVIAALDLLHGGHVDGFCIVSTDSDFTQLAYRIQREGLRVYGFGKRETPDCLRQAYHRFFDIEKLALPVPKSEAKPQEAKPPPGLDKIVPTICKAVKQQEGKDGWAHLGGVGSELSKLEPSFASSSFGFSKLSNLVRASGMFEVEHKTGAGCRIRIRQSCASRPISTLQELPSTQPPPPTAFPSP